MFWKSLIRFTLPQNKFHTTWNSSTPAFISRCILTWSPLAPNFNPTKFLPWNLATRDFAKGKLKTHSGVAKRFKVRADGTLLRRKAGQQHNTGYKTRRRVNRLACGTPVKDKTVEKKMLKLIQG